MVKISRGGIMTEAYEKGKSLKVCDLFAIIPISYAFGKLDELVQFSKKYSIDSKELVSALKIATRAFMSQHVQELDSARNIGIEGSEEYYRSSLYEKHPHRPRVSLLDRLAHCAYVLLKPMWSAESIDEITTIYTKSKMYFEVLESFLTKNITLEVNGKTVNIDIAFLSVGSGQFFADSVLNPQYSDVLSNYRGSVVGPKRKSYLEKNWKGYLVTICYFYQGILGTYYGPDYINKMLEATDIDELWSIGESLWRDAIKILDNHVGSDNWVLKVNSETVLDDTASFIGKECPDDSSSTVKKFDEFLKYHKIRLLDGRTKFFGGPVFFIRLLLGEVHFRQMQDKTYTPVEVIKLIHPVSELNGNRFSYGLLTWSNPQGWIIFSWCGNDYSGGSTKTAMEIEKHIKELKKNVNFRTYTISQKELEDFALSRTSMPKGPFRDLSDEEGQRVLFHEARDMVARISSMFMELLVAAIFSNHGFIVNWSLEDSALRDYEIDITARGEDVCYIIECSHRMKSSISFAQEHISEFNAKTQLLSKLKGYDYSEFQCIYVTREKYFTDSRMKSVIADLETNNIMVTSIEHLIEEAELSDNKKERITEILKEMDCWRPGHSDFTTDSEVQDVLGCLDARNLSFLGTLQIPNDIEIPDEMKDEK